MAPKEHKTCLEMAPNIPLTDGSEIQTPDDVKTVLECLYHSKRRWGIGDRLPMDLARHLKSLNGGRLLVRSVEQFTGKRTGRAKFASLWIAEFPFLEWKTDTAGKIAKYLKNDRSEEGSIIAKALQALSETRPDLPEWLLRTFVLECPKKEIQIDLLFDFDQTKRSHPALFIDCVKRAATLSEDSTVLSGLFFGHLSTLPPSDDGEIIQFLEFACEKIKDEEWLDEVDTSKFLDLIRDLLLLASILMHKEIFEKVFNAVLTLLNLQKFDGFIISSMGSPFSMWKGAISDLAPWMATLYIEKLSSIQPTSLLYSEAQHLLKRIQSGQYKNLRDKPHLAKGQIWRAYAVERAKKYSPEISQNGF